LLLTYYTLKHLAADWSGLLTGARLLDAYSQHRGEVALALEQSDWEGSTLVAVVRPEQRMLFRNPGHGRARSNTASLFETALSSVVSEVRIAHRDRIIFLDLGSRLSLQIALFGPRPNVWLVDLTAGDVVDSFTASQEWVGKEPPPPRAAPVVDSFDSFEARLPASGTLIRAVSRAMPLFDATLARETVYRAGLPQEEIGNVTIAQRRTLFESARELEAQLEHPRPRIYWQGSRARQFALVRLEHIEDESCREELFSSTDDAVRIFSRRTLAQERFDRRYKPVADRLRQVHERIERSAANMMDELSRPSRADVYETYGHLLMAQATEIPPGAEEVTLPDIIAAGDDVTIPLDPSQSAIANAERYYDRARRSRRARQHAEKRWEGIQGDADRAGELLRHLSDLSSLAELDMFLEANASELSDMLGAAGDDQAREPFRRFRLPGGYEAWVGKNARANAELTTRHARPYDLWLHARGVPGSHVVIRRRDRDSDVPASAIEAAARLAAYFSQARTSSLVPVQVTERKYVRPLKGGAPGAVRLDREDVLLVEPAIPEA
jgi:predicted ribosome quality control (RQC) complex YloA/Tae2 family protein